MNTILDKKNTTTAKGANIRVTARTKKLAKAIQQFESKSTGVNKPVSAIIGELVFDRAKALNIGT